MDRHDFLADARDDAVGTKERAGRWRPKRDRSASVKAAATAAVAASPAAQLRRDALALMSTAEKMAPGATNAIVAEVAKQQVSYLLPHILTCLLAYLLTD